MKKFVGTILLLALGVTTFTGCNTTEVGSKTAGESKTETVELLNVSYDPTRELYTQYNETFAKYYQEKTGRSVKVEQSHGGSGKQGRSVIEGIEADIVTLALAYDIDEISKAGLIDENWQSEFKENSAPYTSTIVFLVRKGNPKNIKDWGDLVRSDVEIVTPNPKTSGGARWNYLAAWAWALKQYDNDEVQVREYITKLYKNVVALDSGARGATTSFAENGIGDVLLAWENEAYLSLGEDGGDQFEIVTPSISILAEPPVAIVDANVEVRGTAEIAKDYLEYLYSDEGQEIAARNYYRPRNEEILEKYKDTFADIKLVTIDEVFGGWTNAQATHFADDGVFDQIYVPTN
ncbi:MAG: sulfate ABC transporter substrate-binding protein [Cellulosilyticum sp.]|nr:sulfate ABC transporter substrate-binding protein [Cellulosilyticum sp.]